MASVLAVGRAGYFYPRSPCGERLASVLAVGRAGYFYPRSPCGERPTDGLFFFVRRSNFYPRSPCGERRKPKALKSRRIVFLSTLSLRRATQAQNLKIPAHRISIHALLAESDHIHTCQYFFRNLNFYPRSPCGERQEQHGNADGKYQFLSTLSLRRATLTCQYFFKNI